MLPTINEELKARADATFRMATTSHGHTWFRRFRRGLARAIFDTTADFYEYRKRINDLEKDYQDNLRRQTENTAALNAGYEEVHEGMKRLSIFLQAHLNRGAQAPFGEYSGRFTSVADLAVFLLDLSLEQWVPGAKKKR
jgi:hypothetical protein